MPYYQVDKSGTTQLLTFQVQATSYLNAVLDQEGRVLSIVTQLLSILVENGCQSGTRQSQHQAVQHVRHAAMQPPACNQQRDWPAAVFDKASISLRW
jgi:hypothetical protein